MSTVSQIEANRRNGRRSKGPKTAEGKIVSAQNARKHGLLSKDILLPDEDPEAFGRLVEEMYADASPEGRLEAELTERIIVLTWRLRRIGKAELGILAWQRSNLLNLGKEHNDRPTYSDLLDDLLDDVPDDGPADESAPQGEDVATVDDLLNSEDQPNNRDSSYDTRRIAKESGDNALVVFGEMFAFAEDFLANLSRYETSLDRSLDRALHKLERLQAARKGRHVPVPVAVDLSV